MPKSDHDQLCDIVSDMDKALEMLKKCNDAAHNFLCFGSLVAEEAVSDKINTQHEMKKMNERQQHILDEITKRVESLEDTLGKKRLIPESESGKRIRGSNACVEVPE